MNFISNSIKLLIILTISLFNGFNAKGTDHSLTRNVQQTTEKKFVQTTEEMYLTYLDPIIDVKECMNEHNISVFIHSAGRSSGKYFEKRQTLRKTWVKSLKALNISVYFVVGLNQNHTINEELREEADNHQDIIQFSFIDSYLNLTLKAVSLLRWINKKCQTSTHILKVDDDVLVNGPLLLDELSQFKSGISGPLVVKAAPHRDPDDKWYMPVDLYPSPTYPNYVTGQAYVMTADTISPLINTIDSYSDHVFVIDDLFITGIVAEKAGIPRYKIDLVYSDGCSDGCILHKMVAIFECKDSEEAERSWSYWRNTTQEECQELKEKEIIKNILLVVLIPIIVLILCVVLLFLVVKRKNLQESNERVIYHKSDDKDLD